MILIPNPSKKHLELLNKVEKKIQEKNDLYLKSLPPMTEAEINERNQEHAE